MHPCREYWGRDVAYGSLVTSERPRRTAPRATLAEVWILDTLADAPASEHAELAGLLHRIGALGDGEQSLRQSAAHLQAFLQTGEDRRIVGIATLHRTPLLPAGSFAAAAGVPSRAAREESSATLCAEFMRHLGELGADAGVAQIDWVMVRASDTADGSRSHLGATRVAGVALKPLGREAAVPSSDGD